MKVSKNFVPVLSRILPILFLTSLVIFFFLPLFWPVPQFFVTPDSYLSDILHFNLPLKYVLSESLKSNHLPLWTDLIGTGFPLIAEAEIGAFSLVNLILYRFTPFWFAFNAGYVVTFIMFILGMYVVGRELGWSRMISSFIAIIFTFSGFNIVQIPHYNHLQAFSYTPFIFFVLIKTLKNPLSKWRFLAPFLISQQIFQGHYQYVFMTFIAFSLYSFFILKWQSIMNWQQKRKFMLSWVILLILSVGLAAIQLFPSLEFFQRSTRQNILLLQTPVQSGGFTLSHLIQFFLPYGLGDLRNGTFPISTYGTVPWETFTYIGIIPILLTVLTLLIFRKDRYVQLIWILLIIFFIFVFEHNSPFYFLFTIAPFSWFRFHTRFLAFITFFLLLLAGRMLEQLKKHFGKSHFLILAIFVISCLDVWTFGSFYHPKKPVDIVFKKPDILPFLKNPGRLSNFKSGDLWFDTLYSKGWQNISDYFMHLNGGQPNYFIMQNVSTLPLYSGFLLQKQSYLMNLAYNTDSENKREKIATLSSSALTTLRLNNVSYITTPYRLLNRELKDAVSIPYGNMTSPYLLYAVSNIKEKYYLSYYPKPVFTVNEFEDVIKTADVLETSDAFITSEKILHTQPDVKPGSIQIVLDMPTKKQFTIQTDSDAYFVTSLLLYPGWHAYLDGQPSQLVPANLSGMAVFIPQGEHSFTLQFIPKSLYIGVIISLFTFFIFCILIIRSVFRTS